MPSLRPKGTILNYRLNGKFITRIGIEGKGRKDQLYGCLFPLLTIDNSNGDIYICDSKNNCIQNLSLVKIHSNTLVMLNSPKNTFVFFMHLILVSISSKISTFYRRVLYELISRGTCMQTINPWCFFIDNSNNIIISDGGSNSILIFSPQTELIHKISVSNCPAGVTVDNRGRWIVLSSDDNCIQIY